MDDIIRDVIQFCNEIYNELGSGFAEVIYQKALFYELIESNYRVESEKIIPIFYKGYNVGNGRIDLYISSRDLRLIIELKAITGAIGYKEVAQIETYSKNIGETCSGVIINFPQPSSNKQSKNEIEYKIIM
jgi:GxxExxY protein